MMRTLDAVRRCKSLLRRSVCSARIRASLPPFFFLSFFLSFSLSLSLFLFLFPPLLLSTLRAPGGSEALRVVVYALAAANAIGRYARVTGHGAAMNRLDDGADAERSARY